MKVASINQKFKHKLFDLLSSVEFTQLYSKYYYFPSQSIQDFTKNMNIVLWLYIHTVSAAL